MPMAKMQKLSFSNNKIVSVRPMRRLYLPSIIQIQLGKYFFIDRS